MRISGTESSSVIINQKKEFSKVEKRCPKCAKTSWNQKGWCNKPTRSLAKKKKRNFQKLKRDVPNVPNKLEPKGMV